MVDPKSLEKLDWDKLLHYLNKFLFSNFSKEASQKLKPAFSFEEAILIQQKSKFVWNLLEKGEKIELTPLISLQELFNKASKRGFFLPIELAQIKKWFISLKRLIPLLKDSPFEELLRIYEEIKELEKSLDRILDYEKTEIKDRASYNLFIIRKKLKEIKELLFSKLEKIKNFYHQKGYLQDNLFTHREGRYVLPIKVEYKNKVKGILHEVSQSGATVFIEPISITSLNNQIEDLKFEEQREVIKILKEVSSEIFNKYLSFSNLEEIYQDFEITVSKVKLGRLYKGIFPVLKKEGDIKLLFSAHPLLILRKIENKIKKVIYNDFIIESGLIISGPNLGGKTVALKTIGILILMGQSGFPIPAKKAEFPIFSQVFIDLGDEQDIIEGESSFSSHLKNLKEIFEKADDKTLVLLDEPGKGTNPDEGSALIAVITKELIEKKTKIIITTHSPILKNLTLKIKELKLATMGYDLDTKEPNYKLTYGVWGESLALDLAQKIGFPQNLLEKAINYLHNKAYWEAYKSLEEEKKKIKIKEEELILKLNQVEKKRQELEKEREKLMYFWNEEFKKLLKEIKAEKISYKKALDTYHKFLEKVQKDVITKEEDFKEGDKVWVLPFKNEGEILKIKDNLVEVKIGNFKAEVFKGNITKKRPCINSQILLKKEKLQEPNKIYKDRKILNLIGLTVEEALKEIEKIINNAFLEGIKKIYLIHGHGTGKLKQNIWKYLTDHPLVKNFEFADIREGGSGVTIAYLEEKN